MKLNAKIKLQETNKLRYTAVREKINDTLKGPCLARPWIFYI